MMRQGVRPNSASGSPRPAALDRIGRVVETRRRGVAADDEAVDQRFVLGGEAIVERAQIVGPVLLGARACGYKTDERRVQHPRHRQLPVRPALALPAPPFLLRAL